MTYTYAAGLLWSKLSLKIVIFSIFLCVEAHARGGVDHPALPVAMGEATDTIIPLQIGDAIPEALWHLPLQVINHPDGKKTITLNDYRRKLIILDFWARGCGSCIAAFPKLDSLQQQYSADFQVILVTNEPRETVSAYLHRRPLDGSLFSVVGTKAPHLHFQHFTIPHYAWISREGYLMATTGTNQVSGTNLRAALAGKTEGLVMKRDLNPRHPFFLSEKLESLPQHYSFLYQGFYPGLASQIKRIGLI